jgi:hypothetical protein
MLNATEIPSLLDLLSLRRAHDVMLRCGDEGSNHVASITIPDGVFYTVISPDSSNHAILQMVEQFCNKAIDKPPYTDEFRFTTHDFTDPSSWDGRTNGDPAKTWAEENGATQYDDVQYRWLDANGDPVAYLAGPIVDNARIPITDDGVGNVWLDASDDSVIVQYNPGTQHWEREDNSENVTSSRWSIVPYPNYKMKIIMANAIWGADAVVNGTLRYTVYMHLDANVAAPGAPAGSYPVRQFAYPTSDLLKMSADRRETVGQDIEATYDYRTTIEPVIDSLAQMRLELTLDGNLPVTSATGRHGRAVFIGKKIVSF